MAVLWFGAQCSLVKNSEFSEVLPASIVRTTTLTMEAGSTY